AVRAWNRTREKAEGLGADVFATPAEAVAGADVVVTMLADGPTVERVMEGITLSDDQVWWQASTVGLEWLERLGGNFVDGPRHGPAPVPRDHRGRPDGHAVREAQGQRDDRALVRAELPARPRGEGRRADRRRGARGRNRPPAARPDPRPDGQGGRGGPRRP